MPNDWGIYNQKSKPSLTPSTPATDELCYMK